MNRSICAACALILGVFLVDIVTPLGYADWVLYLVPLFLVRQSRYFPVFPSIITLLLIAGFYLSPMGGDPARAALNRLLSAAVIWFASFLILRRERAEGELRKSHAELERRVQERTEQLSLANASLQDEIAERRIRQEQATTAKELSDTLNNINAAIHSSLDLDVILQKAAVEAAKAIKIDASSIGLFDKEHFVVRCVYNMPETIIGRSFPSRELKGIQYAASVRDVVVFNDASNDERLNRELMRKYGIRSMLVGPLLFKETVLGAMNLFSFAPLVFTDIQADFVRKLSASLSLALENARLYEDRRTMEERMRHLAHHDALTGLPNRRFFIDIVQIALAQAHRRKKRTAILFLDLDRFKEINDAFGHEAGDEFLKEVAERLKAQVRESDTIARIGGDEFNIVIPDIAHEEDAVFIAGKILDAIRRPYVSSGREFHSTASIGISVYPDDAADLDRLLRYADIALYSAKEQGRNNYQFYDRAVNTRRAERTRLENRLQQALERGELEVYYQPQVEFGTGKLVNSEALVRWRHPERGLLEPKQFLFAAEETGFILSIDQWVLGTACSQIKSWLDAGLDPGGASVNLSSRQFRDPELVSLVSRILTDTGLPPACLNMEISETAAMDNIERTIGHLNRLSALGVRVSIDDFGTGYSSLNFLKRLPIQKLKIDRSFVREIAVDAADREIISAVTAMAHSMKIRVLAEGVETEEQLAFLRSADCDEAQGFLFSRPLSAAGFERFIRNSRHHA